MAKGEYDEHLIKQMTLINHADICTIDSFCLRIVKEYFARVELDCAFGIADDTEMKIIKHDVMDQVMEMCYEDESVSYTHLDVYKRKVFDKTKVFYAKGGGAQKKETRATVRTGAKAEKNADTQ